MEHAIVLLFDISSYVLSDAIRKHVIFRPPFFIVFEGSRVKCLFAVVETSRFFAVLRLSAEWFQ